MSERHVGIHEGKENALSRAKNAAPSRLLIGARWRGASIHAESPINKSVAPFRMINRISLVIAIEEEISTNCSILGEKPCE
jgi:hypothetical protein